MNHLVRDEQLDVALHHAAIFASDALEEVSFEETRFTANSV